MLIDYKSFSLIPQPLLPQEEKGSKKKLKIFKVPRPLWERDLG
jgi:hypothetical protein